MATIQKLNAEMVRLLGAIFQRRYEPNFALGNAMSLYKSLPGLRGFWGCSAVSETPTLTDLSGMHYNLTANGIPLISHTGIKPHTFLDGTGDCWSSVDHAHWDISGTESFISGTLNGLTIGAWVYPLSLDIEDRYIIAKWNHASNDDSYKIDYDVGVAFRFSIRDPANTLDSVDIGSTSALNNWYFIAGRFDPSSELKIWVNGDTNSKATVLASIKNSTSLFVVGAASSLVDREWHGRIAFPFITAAAIPDAFIFTLFQQTRALFGV